LYIANEDNAVTTIVDLDTRQVVKQVDVGVEPEGMAISPDDKTAVTTSETTNMAHFIDTTTFEVKGNVLVDQRPRHAEFTADGMKLWVSSEIGGTVSIIDVASQTVEQKITFEIQGVPRDSIQPVGIEFTGDGTVAFIALGPANRVAVVDMKTAKILSYILVGQRVWHLSLSPDGSQLFTTNGVSNDVTVIDTRTTKATKSIKVGRYPWGVAVKPSPEFVAGSKSSELR
jgi:PQQ-dependent catabolism-associated beta-propeller protein